MANVILRNITKSFGDVCVIHGVDLDIADNEFVVFVGPSGCGKSTLLRLIAGLEDVDDGTVHIGGQDVTDLEPVDRGISMVFQSYALYPHMTVRENMSFGLKVTGVAEDQIAQRVAEAAKSLQLDEYLDRKPSQLSGGQRQRVAIGRAIVRKPEVFLFDEPLSNLDAELRVHMRIEIARLHNRLGSTMIYVTHDQIEAMTLADKIVVLQDGRIEQVGSPLDLYDDPNNLFVAGFIGSPRMNFMEATVQSINKGSITIIVEGDDGQKIDMKIDGTSLSVGTEVRLGIRPEHMAIETGKAQILSSADVSEQMGATGYLHSYTSAGTHLVVEIRERLKIGLGEKVALGFDPSSAFIFGLDGNRLR